jgi:hypothetical protein
MALSLDLTNSAPQPDAFYITATSRRGRLRQMLVEARQNPRFPTRSPVLIFRLFHAPLSLQLGLSSWRTPPMLRCERSDLPFRQLAFYGLHGFGVEPMKRTRKNRDGGSAEF